MRNMNSQVQVTSQDIFLQVKTCTLLQTTNKTFKNNRQPAICMNIFSLHIANTNTKHAMDLPLKRVAITFPDKFCLR